MPVGINAVPGAAGGAGAAGAAGTAGVTAASGAGAAGAGMAAGAMGAAGAASAMGASAKRFTFGAPVLLSRRFNEINGRPAEVGDKRFIRHGFRFFQQEAVLVPGTPSTPSEMVWRDTGRGMFKGAWHEYVWRHQQRYNLLLHEGAKEKLKWLGKTAWLWLGGKASVSSLRAIGRNPMGASLASGAGMMLAANAFSQENKTWLDNVAGGLYGFASLAAMAGGWGMVAAGAAAAVGYVLQYWSAVEKGKAAVRELAEYNSQWAVKDGVIVNEKASGTIKWLQLIWQKHHDIREELDLRIQRHRELLGLESGDKPDYDKMDATVFNTNFSQMADAKSTNLNKWRVNVYGQLKNLSSALSAPGIHDELGANLTAYGWKKVDEDIDWVGNYSMLLEAFQGKTREDLITEYTQKAQKIYADKTLDDSHKALALNKIWEEYNQKHGPDFYSKLPSGPVLKGSKEEWEKWINNGGMSQSRWVNEILYRSTRNFLQTITGEQYARFIKARDDASLDLMSPLTSIMNLTSEGLDMNNIGSAEWWARMGYRNGTFVPTFDGVYTSQQQVLVLESMVDEFKKKLDMHGVSLDDTRLKTWSDAIKKLEVAISYFNYFQEGYEAGKTLDDITKELKNKGYVVPKGYQWGNSVYDGAKWVESLNDNALQPDNGNIQGFYDRGYKQGEAQRMGYMDGFAGNASNAASLGFATPTIQPLYPFDSAFSSPFTNGGTAAGGETTNKKPFAGAPYLPGYDPLQDLVGKPIKGFESKGINSVNGEPSDSKPNKGTNPYDYGSKRKSVTPKQINIKIDNLMKVDSIDLTNPQNVAVINRIKQEVAYALYEAAADGTAMLNGLATQEG